MNGERFGVQVFEMITIKIDYCGAYSSGSLSEHDGRLLQGYGSQTRLWTVLAWLWEKVPMTLQCGENQKSTHDISEASEKFGKQGREVMLQCDLQGCARVQEIDNGP